MHDLHTRFNNFTLGFDDLFQRLEVMSGQTRNFPPYNIDSYIDEDTEKHITITLAVAGFGEKDISVNIQENILTIVGSKGQTEEEQTLDKKKQKQFLHQGISERKFERKFVLGQYVEVNNVTLKDGLLVIDTKTVIPEHAKSKFIPINQVRLPEDNVLRKRK